MRRRRFFLSLAWLFVCSGAAVSVAQKPAPGGRLLSDGDGCARTNEEPRETQEKAPPPHAPLRFAVKRRVGQPGSASRMRCEAISLRGLYSRNRRGAASELFQPLDEVEVRQLPRAVVG